MPQDQDDIKGADAMKQAPTPGPLSVLAFHCESARLIAALRTEAERIGKGIPTDEPGFHKDIWTAAEIIEQAEEAFAFKQKMDALAPTAPVEASGSERESVAERVEALADRIDDITDERHFPAFLLETAWELQRLAREEILPLLARPQPSGFLATLTDKQQTAALSHTGGDTHPQPSGETLEQRFPALNDHLIRMASSGNTGSLTEWGAFINCIHEAIRPAPVASGGQHSSGEGESDLCRVEKAITAQPGVKKCIAHGDISVRQIANAVLRVMGAAPVAETAVAAAIVDRLLDNIACATQNRSLLVGDLSEDKVLTEAVRDNALHEIERLLSLAPLYAAPVPAQDDDKLRIAVEALEPITVQDVNAKAWERISQALAALKSTAAQEGGSK